MEEEGRKEEIKEIKEEEKKTKQDQKGKMESEEEEGIGKTGDTIEEVEEIYHDTVKEEENIEEDSKEKEKEEKEENEESEIEVIKHADVNRRRQTGTRAEYTEDFIRKNDGEKSQARQASNNVSMRRSRTRKRLLNYARRTVRSQTGTSSGRTGCAPGQTVNSRGERDGQYGRHKYDK